MSAQAPSVVIETSGLTRRFGDLVAVDGVDLRIRQGEVFGFLGPNGAGKSTLIRLLMGLMWPSSGQARVLDLEIPRQTWELRPLVGYMPQRFSLYDDLTVQENLDFAAEVYGLSRVRRKERLARTYAEFGLGERRNQRPETLSGGWRQRLALAAATIHEPELLVLDEPTAGVDPENRRLFWEKLFELGRAGATILVSTHYMDEAIRCHRLCMMREGQKVAEGAPGDLCRHLQGRVVQIEVDVPEEAIVRLRAVPEVASVAQMGNRLHVLLRPGESAHEAADVLGAAMRSAGHDLIDASPYDPNLEDVFVALNQGESFPSEDAA